MHLSGLVGVRGPGLPEPDQTFAHRLLSPRTHLPCLHQSHSEARGNANRITREFWLKCTQPCSDIWSHIDAEQIIGRKHRVWLEAERNAPENTDSVYFVQLMVLWSWSLSFCMRCTSALLSVTFHHIYTHNDIGNLCLPPEKRARLCDSVSPHSRVRRHASAEAVKSRWLNH